MLYTLKENYEEQFIELNELLTEEGGFALASSYEDYKAGGRYLLLSEEQEAFYAEHPTATVKEVWDMELVKPYTPTAEELKRREVDRINRETDMRILSGFVWQDMAVWLSTENQFNYKAAYDLAVQSGGQSLPVMFKFGTDEETVYHTFTTMEELTAFYLASVSWVQTCLAEGWAQKDGLDTSAYEELLAGEEEQRKDVTEG